jgi:diaminopimelate epimerase
MKFTKYQALGNDYLVIEPAEVGGTLTPSHIRQMCDRHYGAGADGVLFGPLRVDQAIFGEAPRAHSRTKTVPDFALRIFNPDGSEAEKSGNGLRVFCRYLWDYGLVAPAGVSPEGAYSLPFTVQTRGGMVRAQILASGKLVTIEMGQASFDSRRIPVEGPLREVIDETMVIEGQELHYSAVTLGNPHCVILCEQISKEIACKLGPLIENEPRFPHRTNVQFLKVLDQQNIQIEIWERGVGYTLASGSSSCAATAVAYRLGLCGSQVTVQMPGGELRLSITEDLRITMTGPVVKVYDGVME